MNYFFKQNLKSHKNSKSKFKKILKFEKYSQNVKNNKKNDFDGICLNNMILEDIKDQIHFTFANDKKIIKRNRNKKKEFKNLIFSEKLFNSVKNSKNKKENEKLLPPTEIEYLKTMPSSRLNKEKLDKKNENNSNLILLNLNNDIEKINYDIERSKYYKKTISKRMNFFFGKKNFKI